MSKETMTIAYRNGGILPAEIAGGKERRIAPHEPVKVPRSYGEHLVHDRFAYEVDGRKKATARKASSEQVDPAGVDDLKKHLSDLQEKIAIEGDLDAKAKLETEAAELSARIDAAEKGA